MNQHTNPITPPTSPRPSSSQAGARLSREGLRKSAKDARRAKLAGLGVATIMLGIVGCRSGETSGKAESSVMSDPLERNYTPEFIASLGEIESTDIGKLPEKVPGKLEVTLTGWQPGGKVSYRVGFDTSQQVIGVSIPEDVTMSHRPGSEGKFSPPLAASMAEADVSAGFHSASMLAFKAKQFDDGLYAAVEEAADRGAGKFSSRRELLADLAAALTPEQTDQGGQTALGLLGAATGLSGHPVEIPTAATKIATELEKEFLKSPLRSKPIGFYTWSEDLAGTFQRDRLLQTKLKPETAKAFAGALGGDADLRTRYRAALRLPERLTNGFASEALSGAAADVAAGKAPALNDLALFPPSRAYETDLIRELYGNSPIPDGFDLADEMVRRIQSGELNLSPDENSGWYDYQTYALEPLVVPDRMPEAKHLKLDASYRKELVKLFKSLLALTRETHIKQLEEPWAGSAEPPPGINLSMSPHLSQEPLATFYLRRALAYRFVRGVLVDSFGGNGLTEMKRLTAAGPMNLTLDRELRFMESLFYGAYLNTAHELGMTPEEQDELGLGTAKSLALYRSWKPKEDPDVSRDMRMMVPVFYDVESKQTKVWVVLGVTTRPLQVRYQTPPKLGSIVDQEGKVVDPKDVNLKFEPAKFTVAYPVMAEIYVTKILDRQEMRALCDEQKTQEAILEHLK